MSTNVTTASPRSSYSPVLSDDGRFVAFKTLAAGKFLVFRRDLQSAALDVISTNAAGLEPLLDDAYGPEMSSDGRYVAFSSPGTTAITSSIWHWDGQTKTASLVSANLQGQPSSNGLCEAPAITPDGRFVAFVSNGTDLVTNEVNGEFQVYVRDLQSGATQLATRDADGAGFGNAESAFPVLTPDGRFVLFDSRSDAFVVNDQNDAYDVFVRDMAAGTTELISREDPGTPAGTANNLSAIAANSHGVSSDGRFVVFESLATNLVPGDTNGFQDVFIRDLQTGTNGLVSVNALGSGSANGPSANPSISANGRYVLFTSTADNLVANDTNKLEDVFVRDLAAGTTLLVAVGTRAADADRASSSPSISADGRWIAFQSTPRRSAVSDIFIRDLAASTTTLLSTNIPGDVWSSANYAAPIVSADGRFVAFKGVGAKVFVRDLQTGLVTEMGTNATSMAFSGNSRVFAAICGPSSPQTNYFILANLLQGTNRAMVLGPGASSSSQGLSLSQDGRFVAFTSRGPLVGLDTNGVEDVFLYDATAANLTLVSANQTGATAGNGRSYWPQISADGRHVAFRSAASDLVPGDANGWDDIFLFDRLTGQTTLLSHSLDSTATANGMSLGLAMAAEAKLVVFNSAASDLVDVDHNETVDVFAVPVEQTALVDLDQDGLDDSWELAYFNNLSHSGLADSDGDGLTDAAEYRAGTNPIDPALALNLAGVAFAAGQTRISWTAAPGRSYRAQYKDALSDAEWHDLPDPVTLMGASASVIDSAAAGLPRRFYRLVLVE
ncbi:MAG: PD40 domain-containing protein [Chloroflexi bacterium]|nr:PD40 domain-containing protein [Chloroflexota bacterium]